MDVRFRDPSTRLEGFAAGDIDVVCPDCAGRGRVTAAEPRRFSCTRCARSIARPDACMHLGGPVDPFFRLPLWFQARVRGRVLWAYNEAHLTLLEHYVSARLRERGTGGGGCCRCCSFSLVERLPVWIKSAKNRPGIHRTITRLRASAR